MGDRHGGRFARRGRTLSPSRPQVDAHRAVGLRWRATVFRCRGAVDRIYPAQEHAPRRRPPDTAHERKDLPRAGTRPTAKASRHGARAKGFAPAQERSPRRRPPDTARRRKDLPHARRLSSAKASRHGARAKGFARAETLSLAKASRHGARAKGFARAGTLPTAKASRNGARAKGFARAETLPTAKASRHGARAKGFAPRRNALLGEGLPTRRKGERICPAGVRVRPACRRTAGRPRPTDCRKNTPSAGSHPRRRGRCRIHSPKKNKTTP